LLNGEGASVASNIVLLERGDLLGRKVPHHIRVGDLARVGRAWRS
jgi:hypothetical protein